MSFPSRSWITFDRRMRRRSNLVIFLSRAVGVCDKSIVDVVRQNDNDDDENEDEDNGESQSNGTVLHVSCVCSIVDDEGIVSLLMIDDNTRELSRSLDSIMFTIGLTDSLVDDELIRSIDNR
jgi:hypothetical protein